MLKKTAFTSMLVMLSSMLVILAFNSDGLAQAKRGGTIVEGLGAEPTNLDIFKAGRRPELTILRLIIEPLVVPNEKLEVVPLLARSWNVSKDQLTWTFTLNRGIKFHDGTPLNAEAVKFSIERHKKGIAAVLLTAVKEVQVVNEYTVAFKLERPFPGLLDNLAQFAVGIVSPTAVQKAGSDWGSKVIVGTGPFKFKNWVSGDRINLERFEGYKHGPSFLTNRGPAYVDEWVVRFLLEPTTLIGELTEGNVDLTNYITERDAAKVKSHPNTDLKMVKSTIPVYLVINCAQQNERYNDLRVRQALTHAVNKEVVIKAAMFGIGDPLYTPLAPNIKGFSKEAEEIGKRVNSYDPEQAKKLLDEAGWKAIDKDGVREKDGKKLDVDFLAFTIAGFKQTAEVVIPMLEAVGFKPKLQVLEAGDLYQRVLARNFDLLSTSQVTSQAIALNDLVRGYHSKSIGTILQWSHYNNPEMDRLLDTAQFSLDSKERAKALVEAHKLSVEDVPVVPIANQMGLFGYKKTLGGVDNYFKHPLAYSQLDGYRALEIYKR
ncbi:MAG: ABC transporter substrate-binding protein [Candidatus Methylomirabilota bacterium]|jgi:peptide/nickel transport system substrate-binding protein